MKISAKILAVVVLMYGAPAFAQRENGRTQLNTDRARTNAPVSAEGANDHRASVGAEGADDRHAYTAAEGADDSHAASAASAAHAAASAHNAAAGH